MGGLINTRKIELVHMVLKDIAMFHNRHRRQPLFNCCHDFHRMKTPIHTTKSDMKEKHSATICDPIIDNFIDESVLICSFIHRTSSFDFRIPKTRFNRHQSFPCTGITTSELDQRRIANIAIQVIGDSEMLTGNTNDDETINALFPYRSKLDLDEPETYYCLNVSFYQPIAQPKHDHHVSLLSMHHIIDFNNLQMLRFVSLAEIVSWFFSVSRNGSTLILYDEDTMHTCLVTVRLELDNCTLTW